MKKIIPFNNVLNFSTDVREITAISLEHEINKYPDMISGVFYISGEYKITDGQLEKEKFNFELPFDIALSTNYKEDSLVVDIDDFRYDLISDKDLKVNIDLYVDGELDELLESDVAKETIELPLLDDVVLASEEVDEIDEELPREDSEEIELLDDMLLKNKENIMEEEMNTNIDINNNIDNDNNNIFNPSNEEYVTYKVYKVLEGDSVDSILNKYNITKEMLENYNDIESINPGDKLIIPTNEK